MCRWTLKWWPARVRASSSRNCSSIEQLAWTINEELSAGREDSLDVVLKVQTILGPRPEQGKLNIILLDGEKRGFKSEEITNRLRERIGAVPGVSNLSLGLATPFGKPVSVSLRSNDLAELECRQGGTAR